jgi:nucleoside-diphosphate-sugar epimerase
MAGKGCEQAADYSSSGCCYLGKERTGISRVCTGVYAGTAFFMQDVGTPVKACIYVKDLAHFMLYAIEHSKYNVELFNCAYQPAFTIEHTVETMKKVTGLKRHIIQVNGTLLIFAATVIKSLGGTRLGIHPARVKKLMVSTNICGKKMASSGYVFKYTFEEAIRDWYNDNDNQHLQ